MKLIKIILTTLFLFVVVYANAQEVVNNGNTYQVDGEVIFMDGNDVTKTLTLEEKEQIKNAVIVKLKAKKSLEEENEKVKRDKEKVEKERKDLERKHKKTEKKRKKAEKARKKVEKKLKKEKKALKNLDKAKKKYKKAQGKYEKLKRKGKLSPVAEGNWLKKIEKLKNDVARKQRKI